MLPLVRPCSVTHHADQVALLDFLEELLPPASIDQNCDRLRLSLQVVELHLAGEEKLTTVFARIRTLHLLVEVSQLGTVALVPS